MSIECILGRRLHLYTGSEGQTSQSVYNSTSEALKICIRIEILHRGRPDVQFVLWSEPIHVLVEGKIFVRLSAEEKGSLVCPSPSHVPHGVATTSDHQERHVE